MSVNGYANGDANSSSGLIVYDVLIIGGGPSGLSVALSLMRSVHKVVVFDSGVYRNARANWFQTVPTWDSEDPAAFRDKARANLLAKYDTARFEAVWVEHVEKLEQRDVDDPAVRVVDERGREWLGKKLVLATGVQDLLLPIPGYDDCWYKGGM